MRSSTIALIVGLIAAPAAIVLAPQTQVFAAELFPLVDNTLTTSTFGPRQFEPAPMIAPAVGVSRVELLAAPGSRATGSGPINGTPFSAGPGSVFSEGGAQTSQADRTLTADGIDGATPSLGK
ncbi:hypothetical protein [Acidisphaera sp. L21]|uniref:hypothetical protein n=1 Tax=Acidisphaera sp. L21 TaxID=1641851 RepID=UPI00131BE936|nr:hypothetical protein [Acidisphaera sp. L21]